MRCNYKFILIVFIISVALFSCKRRPGYVIDPDSMSSLLADIHIAEAVIDNNRRDYSSDSSRQVLKQSVMMAHGVTQEQFDTSLVWYAHNIDKYIDVYDNAIALLDAKNANVGSMMTASAMSMSGDSVDLWGGARYLKLNGKMPTSIVAFDVHSDENTLPGDVYTWRIKLLNAEDPNVNWGIVANYQDNTMEQLFVSTSNNDWNEATFMTDSTKQLVRIRGYFEVDNIHKDKSLWIDSISLVRKRVTPEFYLQTSNRQKSFKAYK